MKYTIFLNFLIALTLVVTDSLHIVPTDSGFIPIPDTLPETFQGPVLPDDIAFLSADKIIMKYGYPVEVHTVETADGYLLTLFRIPYGKNQGTHAQRDRIREPILVLPPFLSSASDYLLLEPESILPFMYADAGFDVWIGGFRGTKYALKNKFFGINDNRFWNFTMDAFIKYDTPAQIDYVLGVTGMSKLSYFGFSMSGGTIFGTLSLFPEYNRKIRRITVVAPGVYIGQASSLLINNRIPPQVIQTFYERFFHGAIVVDQVLQPVAPFVCSAFSPLCYLVLKFFDEYVRGGVGIAKRTLIRVSGQFPSSTSALVYTQIKQRFKNNDFGAFDYGVAGNLAAYGQPTRPQFNVSMTTVPVCGLYGPADAVIVPADAVRALSQLPRWCNRNNGAINNTQWRHVDNLWGDDVARLVYARSVAFFKQEGAASDCSC